MCAHVGSRRARAFASLLLGAVVAASGISCHSTLQADRRPDVPALDARQRPTAAAFFRSPLISHLALSPNGLNLAGVLERGGVEVVFARALGGREIRPLGKLERTQFSASRSIRSLRWGGDERILVSLEMPSHNAVGVRARQTRLMVVKLDGSDPPRYLGKNWPYEAYSSYQDRVIAWTLPGDPDHILLNWWAPDEPGVSARKVDVRNGSMQTAAFARLGMTNWYANHLGEVLAGSGASRTGTEVFTVARRGPDDRFEEISRYDRFTGKGFSFAGFSEKPGRPYVWSEGESDRTELRSYDLATRALGPAIYANADAIPDDIWTSPRDGHLVAVHYTAERAHWHFVDEEMGRVEAAIDRELPDTGNEIVSMDREERIAIVLASSDVVPPRYYAYDRERDLLVPLFGPTRTCARSR